jgi:hypothetical protein
MAHPLSATIRSIPHLKGNYSSLLIETILALIQTDVLTLRYNQIDPAYERELQFSVATDSPGICQEGKANIPRSPSKRADLRTWFHSFVILLKLVSEEGIQREREHGISDKLNVYISVHEDNSCTKLPKPSKLFLPSFCCISVWYVGPSLFVFTFAPLVISERLLLN